MFLFSIERNALEINVFFGQSYRGFGMYEMDGIYLNELTLNVSLQGCIVLDERWKRQNVSDPFSRLYYVKEGDGYLVPEGGQPVRITGGHLYFVPAGLTFSYGCTHLEKIYFHVNLAGDDGRDIFAGSGKIGVLPISQREYELLQESLFQTDYISLLSVKLALYQAIRQFGEMLCPGRKARNYGKTVRAAMQLICRETRINWRAEELAGKLFVSESKLRKNFKRETGINLRQYIERQVFARAKELLAGNSLSIEEISESLGFCDRFYFSRRFTSSFGITPAAYRNSISYRSETED
jgi:transcriptional regulator, araC family